MSDARSPAPSSARRSQPELATLAVVALGGGAGSLLRYGVGRALRQGPGGFPVGTLVINLVGSLLLGALVVAVTEVWRPHHLLRPLLGTGFLGGFTTFSTFAVEARGVSSAIATGYIAASVVGGIVAAAVGMQVVRLLEPRFEIAPNHEAVDTIDPDLP